MSETATVPADPQQEQLNGRLPQQEPPPIPVAQPSGQSDPKFYTAEDLAAAREQEKSKLYRRLTTLETERDQFRADLDARTAAEQQAQQQAQQEEQTQREAEMSARELLEQREREWQARFTTVEAQIEQERALREREAELGELLQYRSDAIDAAREAIAPELLDLVHGNTQEEIDASVEDMRGRTARILEQMQGAVQTARQQMPGTRVTTPASGVENSGAVRAFTPEQIRNMSMEDYQKNRPSLLGQGAARGGAKNHGLFG